jgi:hypothetical protein
MCDLTALNEFITCCRKLGLGTGLGGIHVAVGNSFRIEPVCHPPKFDGGIVGSLVTLFLETFLPKIAMARSAALETEGGVVAGFIESPCLACKSIISHGVILCVVPDNTCPSAALGAFAECVWFKIRVLSDSGTVDGDALGCCVEAV